MGGMMAKRSAFLDIIKEKGALVLDGALGTELERYGCDIQHKLWSAKVLMDQPDIIKKIHISYLAAGADIIQSSGYQATVAGFKGLGYGTEEAIDLVKLSVRLAVQARNEFLEAKASGALTLHGIKLGEETPEGVRYFSEGALPKPLVAASVGPYGAFLADGSEYRGYPDVQTEYLEIFHIPRLALFCEEHPDILSFETIPSYAEAIAIARAMSDPFTSKGIPGWIAFSCKDGHHVSSGETIIKCAQMIDKVHPITGHRQREGKKALGVPVRIRYDYPKRRDRHGGHVFYGRSACSGAGGRGGRRGAGGLRDRPGGCHRRPGAQPPGDGQVRPRPRGDRSHRGSMPAFGRLASVGVYPVRDAGTLPHVCRGHYQRPHPPGGLRCFRPEVRRCGFGVQSVFHGVQSSPASGKRRPGSRVRGAADGIFP